MARSSESEKPAFDQAFLRKKYEAERLKRLRSDGKEQYRLVDEPTLSRYLEDSHCPPELLDRKPVNVKTQVVVIGGGFGGLTSAVRLIQAGITDFKMIDKAGNFGGTWYWNRFPGLRCDIESYIYMPLLEEMNYIPTEKYAQGTEILNYMQSIGKKFGLYEKAIFCAEVNENKWNEKSKTWGVSTKQGDHIEAKYVLIPGGLLDKPKFPGVPGIETFHGHSFHTSRWDYDYTGGNSEGGLDKLADKTVGIIGTGATGVQVIPHLANHSKHLYVIQRTPSTIDERQNAPTDTEWVKSLTPGWQTKRRVNFDNLFCGMAESECLIIDGWTDFARRYASALAKDPTQHMEEMILVDDIKMSELRARVDAHVTDSDVAERLKPWYKWRCKRPCFHDDYLTSFNKPNVTLVDTNGAGIEAITENGVVVQGKEYKLDCLVFSTGFELMTDWTSASNLQIIGRNDQPLAEKWKEGHRTLHSILTRNFPNCFFLHTAQAGFSPNFTHLLDEQAQHVAWMIRACEDRHVSTVEPTQEAEDEYVSFIEERGLVRRTFLADCTPGHITNEGHYDISYIRMTPYSLGGGEFFRMLKDWRDKGDLKGMETVAAAA